jgi:predicted metal-binding membrane protein
MVNVAMPIGAGRWQRHLLVFGGLGAVTAVGWVYLACMKSGMLQGDCMASLAMPTTLSSLVGQFLAAAAMWSIMMVAMMLPTVLPAATVFDNLAHRRATQTAAVLAPTSLYVVGYIAAWTAYSAVAAVGQIVLSRVALLTPMLESASVVLSALILLGAGAFQFTAFKEACLSKCRTPLAFFLAEWRDGKSGALRVGFKHGSYCVGCCWALMAVMLVVGAMNLVWMAALTFFMLAEKVAPARWRLRYVAGCALMLWGLVVATSLMR